VEGAGVGGGVNVEARLGDMDAVGFGGDFDGGVGGAAVNADGGFGDGGTEQ